MTRHSSVLALFTLLLSALPAGAQNNPSAPLPMSGSVLLPQSAQSRVADARDHRGVPNIPPGHLPPAGMCRVWIDGVPPGRQPRPTDCATAERTRPYDSRVIYGSRTRLPSQSRYGGECRVVREQVMRNGDHRYELECRQPRDGRYDGDRHRDSDYCLDRNRDGRCDSSRRGYDPRRASDYCLDRNRDGRCDVTYGGGYDPRRGAMTLPQMISVILLEQRRFTVEQVRWLGDERMTPRWTDANRDGMPERLAWHDASGRLVQVWVDSTGNGRADLVERYRGGRLVEVIR